MKTLLNEQDVRRGVIGLAEQVHRDFGREPLTVVGVLTGSVILVADLVRLLEMPVQVAFVDAKSYHGTERRDLAVRIEEGLDLAGRNVLLVDDIFDSGQTLARLVETLDRRNPRLLRTAVLMTKRDQSTVALRPDYSAFTIPNEFVVGYGLDYNGTYRNLPHIAVLEDHDLDR